jgi:acyl transferase domain-containing protein
MDHQTLVNRKMVSISPFAATGGALSVAAGRLSFVHGLSGASVSIDTACSSSLVALQVAMSATVTSCLSKNFSSVSDAAEVIECVASVNLLQVAETTMMFQRAGMIALDGRCKTLDSRADGYTRGEACASIVLFDADYLLRARNTYVNSIVLGTSVNQDGRSSTLTAPNGPAQQTVMRRTLALGRVSTHDICYVQLHGTGTPLGDPIEIGALNAVFDTPGPEICTVILGASKSVIGHGEPASARQTQPSHTYNSKVPAG